MGTLKMTDMTDIDMLFNRTNKLIRARRSFIGLSEINKQKELQNLEVATLKFREIFDRFVAQSPENLDRLKNLEERMEELEKPKRSHKKKDTTIPELQKPPLLPSKESKKTKI